MGIDVRGTLSLDGSGWEKTIRSAEESVEELAGGYLNGLKGAVTEAFAVGAVVEMTKKAIEFGAQIEIASKRLGITAESVQQFSFAASQAGSSLELVEGKLDKLAAAIERAQDGSKAGDKLADSFSRLGISVEDLADKSPEEIIRAMGESLEKTGVKTRVTSDMLAIFGKGAGELIPVLQELKTKSDQLSAAHLVVSDGELSSLHELHQVLDGAGLALKRISAAVVAGTFDVFSGKLGTAIADNTINLGTNLDQSRIAAQDAAHIAAMQKVLDIQKELAEYQKGYEFHPSTNPIISEKDEAARQGQSVKDADRAAELEEQHANKQLSIGERIAKNLQNQRELKQHLAEEKAAGFENSPQYNQRRLMLAQSVTELDQLEGQNKTSGSKGFHPKSTDSLASTGNFLGHSSNAIVSIGERQLHVLQQIHAGIMSLGKGGGAVGNSAGRGNDGFPT